MPQHDSNPLQRGPGIQCTAMAATQLSHRPMPASLGLLVCKGFQSYALPTLSPQPRRHLSGILGGWDGCLEG